MPADSERDPLDRWLEEQVRPLPPPAGTFELITRRARRRRIRKAVITVASATAVAAAVAVAVPAGLNLRLSPAPVNEQYAAGNSTASTGTQSLETAGAHATIKATTPAAHASATVSAAAEPTGPVPANFDPVSVTFVSASTGWVIGQAGTPGQCANATNPDICTSIARTDNAGKTWEGSPAPGTTGPDGASGVSGIRFLDGVTGWAFGPELWVTHDEGKIWTKVDTGGGTRVTDLETVGDRAYALFATCGSSTDTALGFAYPCTSYTLMTSLADSDTWTPVGSATSGLTSYGANTSAVIALYGSTGYLVAPDGTLYSGPLGGGWQKVSTPGACTPGRPATDGLSSRVAIALASSTKVALACEAGAPNQPPTVWRSDDSGATWTTAGWPSGTTGATASLAATSTGTLVLATTKGIWVLDGKTWTQSDVLGSGVPSGGFTYVGMTTPEQGVALPADSSLHEIYMTFDGGRTWQPSTSITPGN